MMSVAMKASTWFRWSAAWDRRLLWALLASILLHLLFIAFIGLRHTTTPPKTKAPPKIMDVVLFKQPKKKKHERNEKAHIVANQTLKGAMQPKRDRIDRIARAPRVVPQPTPPTPPKPLPSPKIPPVPTPRPRKRQQRPDNTAQPHLRRQKTAKLMPAPRKTAKQPPAPRPIPLSQLLPSALPFAQQAPRRERSRSRNLMRREANIPINTREEKYAPYAHALVDALEEQWRPGQADYADRPEEARRVLLKLSIDRDGSLAGVEILRPSPIAALNRSAIQAIHDAAPFRPLPSAWGLDRASFFLTFEVVTGGFVFRGM